MTYGFEISPPEAVPLPKAFARARQVLANLPEPTRAEVFHTYRAARRGGCILLRNKVGLAVERKKSPDPHRSENRG